MGEIHVRLGEDQDIELDEVDIGVADSTIAFDITGRILGVDEDTLSQLAGERLAPVALELETVDDPPD